MGRAELSWPSSRLGEGLARLVRRSGLGGDEGGPVAFASAGDGRGGMESLLRAAGADAVPAKLRVSDVATWLRARGPSVVRVRQGSGDRFLLIAGRRRVVDSEGELRRVREGDLAGLWIEDADRKEVETLLDEAGIGPARRDEARAHLLRLRVDRNTAVEAWSLSPPPGASLSRLSKHAGLNGLVALFASTYAIDYGLFVLSWWLLGRGALAGQLEWSALVAWALLLLPMLPFRMLATWSAGRIAVTAGGVLKKRLLAGAMRLHPDELRAEGAGRHLARVFESEAVESLALTGGLLSAAAGIELLVAGAIVARGGGGLFQLALLALFAAAFALVARRYYGERRRWTDERLEMSHDVVERMVGHRTRLAQQAPERRHEGEDEALAGYVELSKSMDRLQAIFHALPRLWLAVSVLSLALRQASPSLGSTLEDTAIGLGGAILASRALTKLFDGFSDLLDASIAWSRVAPLFRAAARERRETVQTGEVGGSALVEARNVSYAYPRSGRLVLKDVDLDLKRGDRILVESPSGGGKSTLISLLNGLRRPSSGVVRIVGIGGLDGNACSDWAQKVATAPQFHENHVFTESFAFNLLMGRRWPPRASDWAEAESLCRELGLGELLDKMPGGMNQVVGDTGWQLSHGEKSRLFLARALLQGGSVVLLDESFAALDPENLRHALLTALERSESLLVVAHV